MSKINKGESKYLVQEIVDDMKRRADEQGTTVKAMVDRAIATQVRFDDRNCDHVLEKDSDPTVE